MVGVRNLAMRPMRARCQNFKRDRSMTNHFEHFDLLTAVKNSVHSQHGKSRKLQLFLSSAMTQPATCPVA